MQKISFSDFTITEGFIKVNAKSFENNSLYKEDYLIFELSEKIIVSDDVIATALSTLCGSKFDEIYFNLEVCDETLKIIEKFTKSKISSKKLTKKSVNKTFFNNENIVLSFSGGFDSLAALILAPNNIKLISIDFGDEFKREATFFKKFKPYILKTNIRSLGYTNNSWTFMGIGCILFSEYLQTGYNIFGTVLESSPHTSLKTKSFNEIEKTPPFNAIGIKDIKYIQGLTEIGTTMLVCHYMPDIVNDSLKSLADPGTEKRYRKQLLTQLIIKKFNKKIKIDITQPPEVKPIFKYQHVVLRFLILYMMKNTSLEEVNQLYEGITNEMIALVENLSLDFYEKFNPNFLETIPPEYRADFLSKLADAKIYPYNKKDWEELEIVSKFLSSDWGFLKNFFNSDEYKDHYYDFISDSFFMEI